MKILFSDQMTSFMSDRQNFCSFADLCDAQKVLEKVRLEGDRALDIYSKNFAEGRVSRFSKSELRPAWNKLPLSLQEAIKLSIDNVARFHKAELAFSDNTFSDSEIQLSKLMIPLSRVGVYVPNGVAPLPSSLIMGATPARVAGVDEIVAAFASDKDGPNPLLLGAAYAAGVDQVVTVGGPQAIAALALGTNIVPKVDFICGPGGKRVTAAKALVSALGLVGIDMLAGPSEVCILNDGSVPFLWTAADLLSQLEHGESSRGYLIVKSEKDALEIDSILRDLIFEKKFNASSDQVTAFVVQNNREGINVANTLAPEHLLLQVEAPEELLPFIKAAGSVFLGGFSSEVLGDYASGTNHILPTSGQAKVRGGLSVFDFIKRVSVQKISSKGAEALGPYVELLAAQEKLRAHEFASAVRRVCR